MEFINSALDLDIVTFDESGKAVENAENISCFI